MTEPAQPQQVTVTQIMTREVRCARQEDEVSGLIQLMVRSRLGCMPVVNTVGRPIGMVTKLDLIEQMFPQDRDQSDVPTPTSLMPRTARELMMPIAITLGEKASVAQAAALMALEGVHHLPIVDPTGKLVGILSTMDVVRWLANNEDTAAAT